MLQWLNANWGTLVICLILGAVIALIVLSLVKNRRAGRTSCGCGCADCAMAGRCHQK